MLLLTQPRDEQCRRAVQCLSCSPPALPIPTLARRCSENRLIVGCLFTVQSAVSGPQHLLCITASDGHLVCTGRSSDIWCSLSRILSHLQYMCRTLMSHVQLARPRHLMFHAGTALMSQELPAGRRRGQNTPDTCTLSHLYIYPSTPL